MQWWIWRYILFIACSNYGKRYCWVNPVWKWFIILTITLCDFQTFQPRWAVVTESCSVVYNRHTLHHNAIRNLPSQTCVNKTQPLTCCCAWDPIRLDTLNHHPTWQTLFDDKMYLWGRYRFYTWHSWGFLFQWPTVDSLNYRDWAHGLEKPFWQIAFL